MAKNASDKGKESFLKQDFNMATIKGLLPKAKKSTGKEMPSLGNSEYSPSLPEVNMLPGSVKETYAAEDLRNKWIKVTAGMVLGLVAIYGISIVTENINQGKVDEISAVTASLQSETVALTPYAAYRTQVEGKRSELSSKMSGQINIAAINTKFNAAVSGAGYEIKSISLTLSGDAGGGGGSCVNPDPFNPSTGIGCLSFSLTDSGNGSMTKFLSSLNEPGTGFVNAYIPNAITSSEEGASIDGSVSVEPSFLTNQYESFTLPIDSITQATTEAPAQTEEGK